MMLMNYVYINVIKNELVVKIMSVLFIYSDGEYGNLEYGFVGDIIGNDFGLGVYYKLIYKLVKIEISQVKDLMGVNFDIVIEQLE